MDLLGALGEADQPTKPREKEAHVDDARLTIGVSLEKLSVTGGGCLRRTGPDRESHCEHQASIYCAAAATCHNFPAQNHLCYSPMTVFLPILFSEAHPGNESTSG